MASLRHQQRAAFLQSLMLSGIIAYGKVLELVAKKKRLQKKSKELTVGEERLLKKAKEFIDSVNRKTNRLGYSGVDCRLDDLSTSEVWPDSPTCARIYEQILCLHMYADFNAHLYDPTKLDLKTIVMMEFDARRYNPNDFKK